MKGILLSVCGAAVVFSVFCLIAPRGKSGNFLKNMAKLICLVCIFSQIFPLLQKDFISQSPVSDADEEFLSACRALAEKSYREEISFLFAENDLSFAVEASCREESPYSLIKIVLSEKDSGISEDPSHKIQVDKAVELLKKRYGCEVTYEAERTGGEP